MLRALVTAAASTPSSSQAAQTTTCTPHSHVTSAARDALRAACLCNPPIPHFAGRRCSCGHILRAGFRHRNDAHSNWHNHAAPAECKPRLALQPLAASHQHLSPPSTSLPRMRETNRSRHLRTSA
jgi:hypothetical protein